MQNHVREIVRLQLSLLTRLRLILVGHVLTVPRAVDYIIDAVCR